VLTGSITASSYHAFISARFYRLTFRCFPLCIRLGQVFGAPTLKVEPYFHLLHYDSKFAQGNFDVPSLAARGVGCLTPGAQAMGSGFPGGLGAAKWDLEAQSHTG
jgi:hypothetical protein